MMCVVPLTLWGDQPTQNTMTLHDGQTITSSFQPTIIGIADFLNTNYPVFISELNGLSSTFQDNTTNNVLDFGPYAISVDKDAQPRALASSSEMSGAESLQNTGLVMGQGVAMQGEVLPSPTGCVTFGATKSPFYALGAELYAAPGASYPQAIWVKMKSSRGEVITVNVAKIFSNFDWPESGVGRQGSNQGFGYLTVNSTAPFTSLSVGFDSENLLKNTVYAGGVIMFNTAELLVDLPSLGADQILTIAGNPFAYSATALNSDQSLAADQLLGLDSIQQNSEIPLGLDPRSLFFLLWQQEDERIHKRSAGTFPSGTERKNRIGLYTMGMGQNSLETKSALRGIWVTWSRDILQNWSAGIVGGYSQTGAESLYNSQQTRYQWGGFSLKRQTRDGLGLSWMQTVLFARNRFLNTRTVPLFQMQAKQEYSGYTGSGLAQLQWAFEYRPGFHIAPYGRVAYAYQNRNAFQEDMFIELGANAENFLLAQNSALQFNAHFLSCMVKECGVLLKKYAISDRYHWWFSGALGHINSLRQSNFQVNFVNFLEFFEVDPEKTDYMYLSPSMGITWDFLNAWSVRLGGWVQKMVLNISNNQNNPGHTWSVWCSVEKAL